MTEEERDERIIAIWTRATDEVADRMMDSLEATNPIYMMANSGARGSFNQIRQLAGMRGLMADPKGEIIARPIKANFMEGLTVLEYFISTPAPARVSRTLHCRPRTRATLRRLVDVSQDVIVRGRLRTQEYIRHRSSRRLSQQERRRTGSGSGHHGPQGQEARQDGHRREGCRDR
jgi:DNA-directed RNA polymerase subunit beta'